MKKIIGILTAVTFMIIIMAGCSKSPEAEARDSKHMVDTDILTMDYIGREDVTAEGFLEAQDVTINVTNKTGEALVLKALNLVIDGVEFDYNKLDYDVKIEAGATDEKTVMQILKRADKYEFNDKIEFDLAVFKESDTENIEEAYAITIYLNR